MNEFKAFIVGIIIVLFAAIVWFFGRYFYRRSVRGTQSNSRSSTEGTGKTEEVRGRTEEVRGRLDESYARATELLQKANDILDSGKRSNDNS